ncbi:MAG: ATP-binding cassette domain-containing protein [Treponema sp.]|nr:ATP-binding cassette domain-containing protein [Treponema sp.]
MEAIMDSNILIIDSINKSYNNNHVLKDIFLKINIGDIVGILGRNGSGKSTLLKIIFGTLEAESKFIKVGDKIYEKLFREKNIAKYLPQNDFLPKQLNVKKIIKMYLGKDKIKSFLNDKIIENIISTKIKNLSGGEIRYLEVKLLMNLDTKYVLLDEPFNGVSPILVEEMKKSIVENSINKGFILTDHDYRNVLSVANKIYIITNGCLKELKNKEELKYYGYIPME